MLLPEFPSHRGRVMELSDGRFQARNVGSNFERPENVSEYFSLSALPSTRISRKPCVEDDISAPMILTKLHNSFILAEVTVSADFEMDWDQGGLVIFAGCPVNSASPFSQSTRRRPYVIVDRDLSQQRGRWAKVGLEFTGGELGVSSVVAHPNCGADWSFTPAFPSLTPREAFNMAMPSLRVKLERVDNDLWIWYRTPDDLPQALTSRSPDVLSRNWKKCREVLGFFEGAAVKGGLWVGCYASRPMDLDDATEDDALFVEFEDLEIL